MGLAGWAWGWHHRDRNPRATADPGGAFDRYPKLQLIIGHLGEALPFMLPPWTRTAAPALTKLDRPIGDYLRDNVHYTFSGFNWTPTFLDLLLEVGVDRIMFSADYPWGSMTQARTFLDELPVSPADRERIAHGNAERLMGYDQARGRGRRTPHTSKEDPMSVTGLMVNGTLYQVQSSSGNNLLGVLRGRSWD